MNKLVSWRNKRTSLIIASSNPGKLKEFKRLFAEFSLNILPKPIGLDVDETGKSFAENARIKALTIARKTGELALADDSGLCVDSLNGAPGIYSSRYANNDLQRINRLLEELKPYKNRKAHFKTAICLAYKDETLIEVEGRCEGLITFMPRGKEGFGYDPIFEELISGKTFAEMEPEQKKSIGHRGKAFKLLIPHFKDIIELN
tara:strand:+ start:48485 stop:49093 length:609 start_codon:yes stop_codon:yes gene_type:complete